MTSNSLLKTCLDFSQLFVDKKNFCLNVKIGRNFKLRVNHSNIKNNSSDVDKTSKKKYVSPSTRRRNNLRLLAFKARRAAKGGCSPQQPVAPLPHPTPDRPGGVGSDSVISAELGIVDTPHFHLG